MSYSATSTISRGGFWSGLTSKVPHSRNSVLAIAALIIAAVVAALIWQLASGTGARDGESFDASGPAQFEEGFTGGVTPAMAPAPAGAPGFFDRDGSMTLTITDDAARETLPPKVESAAADFHSSGGASSLATTQRQIISQGSMSVEVTDVPSAAARVRAIAEGAGGFIEQLSSSGVDQFQQSTMTVRVPQDEFFTVFEQIKGLGIVLSENAGSEDVTERFIDLEARLKSAQQEEASLLSLLDRAEQVSEILIIERELARVRTELEQLQGQLNFLERRVDLATITVFLNHPQRDDAQAPSGSISIATPDVDGGVAAVKSVVARVGGEIDQVFTSVQDGRQTAAMTVRVFPVDFNLVVATVEAQGGVVT